jgi:hypothetical protein
VKKFTNSGVEFVKNITYPPILMDSRRRHKEHKRPLEVCTALYESISLDYMDKHKGDSERVRSGRSTIHSTARCVYKRLRPSSRVPAAKWRLV